MQHITIQEDNRVRHKYYLDKDMELSPERRKPYYIYYTYEAEGEDINPEFKSQMKLMGYTDHGVIVDICGHPMLISNIDIEELNKKLVEIGENPLKPIKVMRINHDGTETEVEFAK